MLRFGISISNVSIHGTRILHLGCCLALWVLGMSLLIFYSLYTVVECVSHAWVFGKYLVAVVTPLRATVQAVTMRISKVMLFFVSAISFGLFHRGSSTVLGE